MLAIRGKMVSSRSYLVSFTRGFRQVDRIENIIQFRYFREAGSFMEEEQEHTRIGTLL